MANNKYKINGLNWDLIIKSMDNDEFKVHMIVMKEKCDFFKSKESFEKMSQKLNNGRSIFLEYRTIVVETILNEIYNSYNFILSNKFHNNITTEDCIDMLYLLDELQYVNCFSLKNRINSIILNQNNKNWINFVNDIYKIKPVTNPLKELVTYFFDIYLTQSFEDSIHLTKIEENDIKLTYDKYLKERLEQCKFYKEKSDKIKRLEMCKEIEKINNKWYQDLEKYQELCDHNNVAINQLKKEVGIILVSAITEKHLLTWEKFDH